MHRVAVLVHDGMAPFEFGTVVEVFGLARPELAVDGWYALDVVAERPGVPLAFVGGFSVVAGCGLDALVAADTVIVPAWTPEVAPSDELLAAIRAAEARGARLVSICSGAFLLAAAGLLDGRVAATHWRHAERLASMYPDVRVDADVLYVDETADGGPITAAGSAAAIDVCLHLVRSDHGSEVANVIARRLVVAPHRDGGQAQFIERPVGGADGSAHISQAMDWALAHLSEPLRVEDMARRAFMSPRTFTRRFTEATGTSPIRWVIEQRVAASLPLLETTTHPVEHVGALVGFANGTTFRQHFGRVMRCSPSSYRRSFR
jgi:AraC family transcriptional regulator, transcriptional activator FtrA